MAVKSRYCLPVLVKGYDHEQHFLDIRESIEKTKEHTRRQEYHYRKRIYIKIKTQLTQPSYYYRATVKNFEAPAQNV